MGPKSTLRKTVVKSQKIHYTRNSKNLKRSTLRKTSERPEWNFTETGPKLKYGFFTEPEPKLNTETII